MGPVSPHMTIMRTALAKVQALPSSIDERLAAIRKALLTLQRNPRGSSCCFSFSFLVSIVIIFWSAAQVGSSVYTCRTAPHPAPCARLSLTRESETEQETEGERGKDRFRRVVADVLLAVVLKIADVTARIIP